MTDTTKHAAVVAGLRELADWYEQHPNVPLPLFPSFIHCVHGDNDEAGMAELATLADAMGVEQGDYGSHPSAERLFGAVEFRVYYVLRASMAAHNADRDLLAKAKAENLAETE